VKLSDPDGRSPNKKYAGTVTDFVGVMNNSNNKVGTHRGQQADKTLQSFSNTEGFIPKPTVTPYFNTKKGRYIYTTKGGWIDMVHFLFYAGRARKYEEGRSDAPVNDAISDGILQENFDRPYSKYSYEDLPSDRFGAEFGVNFFDPNSEKTLAEQVEDYLTNILGATQPDKAPNWNVLPLDDDKKNIPEQNRTTIPIYTLE
jgi:hypothetical protein